jgi:hypothetical protein
VGALAGHQAGALIGGALDAIALATPGVRFVSGIRDAVDGCSGDYPEVTTPGSAVGGAAGGLLGAGIGSAVRPWRRVYP